MKLINKPSRIVGLRVGEVSINLLSPGASSVVAKFILLRDASKGDNINAGQFSKAHWSPETLEAFEHFIDALEGDAVRDLFGDVGDEIDDTSERDLSLKFPSVPILGRSKT